MVALKTVALKTVALKHRKRLALPPVLGNPIRRRGVARPAPGRTMVQCLLVGVDRTRGLQSQPTHPGGSH